MGHIRHDAVEGMHVDAKLNGTISMTHSNEGTFLITLRDSDAGVTFLEVEMTENQDRKPRNSFRG